MFQYMLILFAVMAVISVPSMESLASASPAMEYLVAIGIALLFKPWLEGHLE